MLNLIDGVEFNEAFLDVQKIELENNLIINYIGLNDLVKNKRASGRRQDLTDVKTLERLLKLKKLNGLTILIAKHAYYPKSCGREVRPYLCKYIA
ncbi:hypothetical protein [Pedobacter steynii]